MEMCTLIRSRVCSAWSLVRRGSDTWNSGSETWGEAPPFHNGVAGLLAGWCEEAVLDSSGHQTESGVVSITMNAVGERVGFYSPTATGRDVEESERPSGNS